MAVIKGSALHTFFILLCFFVIFIICLFANTRLNSLSIPQGSSTTRISKMISIKGSVSKLFAYYILTEKCIPPYYLESIAFGNSSRCDVYVNSYKEKCKDQNMPMHITHIFEKTTWSAGRNLLYYHVKKTGRRYVYHIFLDDDAIPIHTDHVIQFRKALGNAPFFNAYLSSDKGLKEGIYWQKEGISAWRLFEDDLLRKSPAFAITNFAQNEVETRHVKLEHWKQVCANGKEMPWIVPTFYLDEMFIAFHEQALPMLLPYSTMFEHVSWWASGIIHIFRARALLYRSGVANYKITVINHKHTSYPRGAIPNDFLAQYLAGDGKDMKGLIDEREMDWKNYDTWDKWQAVFLHTKDMCTEPLMFPGGSYYRLS